MVGTSFVLYRCLQIYLLTESEFLLKFLARIGQELDIVLAVKHQKVLQTSRSQGKHL